MIVKYLIVKKIAGKKIVGKKIVRNGDNKQKSVCIEHKSYLTGE